MSNYLLISDAAKEVKVESHVLRYWEEELHLPIKRNELGHRYYTVEDVERFKQIKGMKEKGLQLKAIKMILKDGKLNVLPMEAENSNEICNEIDNEDGKENIPHMAIEIINNTTTQGNALVEESKEEKTKRLQWLLQQLIRETLRENNQELCREIKESVVKELDYQFRCQEEREEEREQRQEQRNEEYYKKMDELLRKKSKGQFATLHRKNDKKREGNKENLPHSANTELTRMPKDKIMDIHTAEKKAKKKRHSIF